MIPGSETPLSPVCRSCGMSVVHPGAAHCPFCGVPLTPPEPPTPAPYARRMAALGIDWGILLALVAPVGVWILSVDDPTAPDAAGLVVANLLVYVAPPLYWALVSRLWRGQTVGRRLLGIRLVMRDGSEVGYLRTLGRAMLTALLVIGGVGTLIDLLFPLFGDRHQSIADRATDTLVSLRQAPMGRPRQL
jgi:uncharacterized RDD family membrane protein YckC